MTIIWKVFSGKEFNNIYKGYKFVKALADEYADEYKEGLNIYSSTFNLAGKCSAGGIYFADLNKPYMYIDYGNKFSYVTILDEALVYIEEDKFKANMIILTNILPLSEFFLQNIQLCELFVQQNGLALEYVKDQTEEICKLAVKQNSSAFKYVKDQTEEICKLAVQQNGSVLKYFNEQTDELCKLAVKQNGLAFHFVKNQTKEI